MINNLDQTDITPPASTITIVLKGADLQIQTGEASQQYAGRKLIIEALVSTGLGNDLPVNDQLDFAVENLKKIT